MHAVRNIRLCTKDCLCLYVCPTGATDTENGQIDTNKCLDGCRLCVDACSSGAISLVPDNYPEQQAKSPQVKEALGALTKSKTKQEQIASQLQENESDPNMKQMLKAIELSNRIMAEDLVREAGFMLPQSKNVQDFLIVLLNKADSPSFPKDILQELINQLKE